MTELPTFKEIYPACPQDPPVPEGFRSVVIVIPDLDGRGLAAWADAKGQCWLETVLPLMVDRPRVLLYQHDDLPLKDFSWQCVIENGDALLQRLLAAETVNAFDDRPLIFLSHGLGGLVLKRAISVLFQQFWHPAHQGLIAAIAGIAYLGVPHPQPASPIDAEQLALVLRSTSKKHQRLPDQQLQHAHLIANLCQQYSAAALGAPVLSVYEQRPTKLKRTIFSSRNILVNQKFCETLSAGEELVSSGNAHHLLPQLGTQPALYRELQAFFVKATEAFSQRAVGTQPTIHDAAELASFQSPEMQHDVLVGTTSSIAAPFPSQTNSSYAPESNRGLSYSSQTSAKLSPRRTIMVLGSHVANPDFVGRQDILEQLDRALLPVDDSMAETGSAQRLKSFALCGVGGVGKSQIATQFAYTRKKSFDAIFWVNATDSTSIANDFGRIAKALGLQDAKKHDHILTRDLVQQWLRSEKSSSSNKRLFRPAPSSEWLLIFDNADKLDVLKDYWPKGATGSVLVTSRDPMAMSHVFVENAAGIDVRPFAILEAAQWLQRLTGSNPAAGEQVLSQKIVERLSGLPLAIVNVAGAIVRHSLTLSEFLDYYSEESYRNSIYSTHHSLDRPIWATFAFQNLGVFATGLLCLLAFLDPESIPESLFGFLTDGRHEHRPHSKKLSLPSNGVDFVDARTELAASSLIRRNANRKELMLHKIVQTSIIASMDAENLSMSFRTVLDMLERAWPKHNFDWNLTRWKLCQPLLPHVMYLFGQYGMLQSLQDDRVYNTQFAKLLVKAAWYLAEIGRLDEAHSVHALAYKLSLEAPEVDYQLVTTSHMNYIEYGLTTSDYAKALQHAQELVALIDGNAQAQEDTKHLGMQYMAYNSLAEAYMEYKRWDEAIGQCDAALTAGIKDTTGLSCAFALINKAHCLLRKGQLEDAEAVLQEYIDVRDSYDAAGEAFKIALSISEEGEIRAAQGRWDESLALHLDAYERYSMIFARGHFRLASIETKLGHHYWRLGQLEEAKKMMMSSLSQYSSRDYYAAETTRTTFLLARILQQLKDPGAADVLDQAHKALHALGEKRAEVLCETNLEELVATWAWGVLDRAACRIPPASTPLSPDAAAGSDESV